MTTFVTFEEEIASLVSAQTRSLVRAWIQALLPSITTMLIQEEIDKKKAHASSSKGKEVQNSSVTGLESADGFKRLIQETFASQIQSIAWEAARSHVLHTLPEVAERLVLEEIKKLQSCS